MAKIKTFFINVLNWLKAHAPSKRRLIQVYTALLFNANVKGVFTGNLYQGATKYACVPGLNCYSCPGAVGACPLGALQNALAASKTRAPYYVIGIIALFCILLARTVCGWLCPVGLGQDLLYKIKTPKLKKSRFTRILSYLKYVLLAVFVIALPVMYGSAGAAVPAFCKYICPAGTLGGGVGLLINPNNAGYFDQLGPIFTWKFSLLIALIVACVFIYRAFCRFICPLGAIYSFFNRFALIGVKLDADKCTNCGLCIDACKMDIRHVGDRECINCGECVDVCPTKAISFKGGKFVLRKNEVDVPTAPASKLGATIDGMSEPIALQTANNGENVNLFNFSGVNKIAALDNAGNGSASEDEALSQTLAENDVENAPQTAVEETSVTTRKSRGVALAAIKNKPPQYWIKAAVAIALVLILAAALVYYNAFAKDAVAAPPVGSYTVIYGEYTVEAGEIQLAARDDSGLGVSLSFGDDGLEFVLSGAVGEQTYTLTAPLTKALGGSDLAGSYNGVLQFTPQSEDISEADIPYLGKGVYVLLSSSTYAVQIGDKSVAVGALIPDFSLKKYGFSGSQYALLDDVYTLSENLGRVNVINFWATWCGPCVAELPHFNRAQLENPDVNIVAVQGVNDRPVPRFIREQDGWTEYALTFAQDIVENDVSLTHQALNGRTSWPMTYIVNKYGVITFVRFGALSYNQLISAVSQAKQAGEIS